MGRSLLGPAHEAWAAKVKEKKAPIQAIRIITNLLCRQWLKKAGIASKSNIANRLGHTTPALRTPRIGRLGKTSMDNSTKKRPNCFSRQI
jgi:hypothetical protein